MTWTRRPVAIHFELLVPSILEILSTRGKQSGSSVGIVRKKKKKKTGLIKRWHTDKKWKWGRNSKKGRWIRESESSTSTGDKIHPVVRLWVFGRRNDGGGSDGCLKENWAQWKINKKMKKRNWNGDPTNFPITGEQMGRCQTEGRFNDNRFNGHWIDHFGHSIKSRKWNKPKRYRKIERTRKRSWKYFWTET